MFVGYYFSTSPAEEYIHNATKCCAFDADGVISTRPVFTSATKNVRYLTYNLIQILDECTGRTHV